MPIVQRQTTYFTSGSKRFGGANSYSSFADDGLMTAASSARTYKELWFPATVLWGGEPVGSSACSHATSGSQKVQTLGAGASGGDFYKAVISACGTACDMQVNVTFPVPLDVDTSSTASPWVIVEHSLNAAFTTAGSGIGYRLNYNYVTAGSTGTTGSMLTTLVAAGACVAGARVSGSIGKLPVLVQDDMVNLAFRQLTGACGAGAIADIVGVRFRYISNNLGTQVT